MTTSDNWIHSSKPVLSLNDKLKELLKIEHKLVLVQFHELERIRHSKNIDKHCGYINYLYNNYIVNSLPKTYLGNKKLIILNL